MNAPARPVTIVIATWNGLEYTRRCLDTLLANTDHPAFHLTVVDNGSSDGTPEYVASLPRVTLIRNGSNLGFARANNIAMRAAPQDHDIVLLNNDTEIEQRDWLTRLQASVYASPDIALAGCRLRSPDGNLRHAGAYMPLDTFWGQQIGSGEKDINQYGEDRDVESVVFACVYLKRDTLRRVGLLDEEYFCYFEDSDYCRRAAALGLRVVCCGTATILHHENASTRANGVRHESWFRDAQRVFRAKWETELRNRRYTRDVAWHSAVNFPTGYAVSSRELALALDRQGVEVTYRYVYGPGTTQPAKEPRWSDSCALDAIRARGIRKDQAQVVYAEGGAFDSNFGAYKIGFTMLETDGLPKDWVHKANMMDEVWAPSAFNRDGFLASGVTKPIHIQPLGFDPGHFNRRIERRHAGPYTFLSIFEWGERKAPELLLRAFNDEFRAEEDVILLVKTSNVDPEVDVRGRIAKLGLDPAGGKIHLSLNQITPGYQLGMLYRSADCFVLPTRGEGWGLPILEAMACGLPAIATDWSAPREFMTQENSYPLPVEKLIPARAKCPYYRGFRWAEPSYAELRRLMRRVFERQDEAREVGERAAREVRDKWTWDHAAHKIIARLDAIRG